MILVHKVTKKMKIYQDISTIKKTSKESIRSFQIVIPKNQMQIKIDHRIESTQISFINKEYLQMIKSKKLVKKQLLKCLLMQVINSCLNKQKLSMASNMQHIIKVKRSHMIIT